MNADTTPRPRLGVISDETGSRLDDCIAFCVEEGLDQIEIRMVDGIPPLSLDAVRLADANARIEAAKLTVSGIATPLLKWEAPGRKASDRGDQFGFERKGRSDDGLALAAIRVADVFQTRNLRIFSYLKHDGFELDDLKPSLDRLLELAEKHDKTLLLENEPVCNIARMDELADVVELYATPRLQALPDIGNSAQIGEFPSTELIARLMPSVTHVHFKDYSKAKGRFVPLGEGDIRLEEYVAEVLAGAGGRTLSFSLETHVHDDPLGATLASFRKLRETVDHLLPAS